MIESTDVMFEDRPLTDVEKSKLNTHYLTVITYYERKTKRPFMKDELIVLKLMIEFTTPAAINKMIDRFYNQYPGNFQSLHYIYQPVKNMFSNKKRRKSD